MQDLKEITQEDENTAKHEKYFISTIQSLSKQHDLCQFSLPPLPELPSTLLSHPATGDTPVDPADNVAANVPEDSGEDHATTGVADVLPNVLGMVLQNLQKTTPDESFMILAISVLSFDVKNFHLLTPSAVEL